MIHYIDPIQAKEMMNQQEGIVILDVREADEYAFSHIPGSVLFPLSEMETTEMDSRWPKSTCFLIYCRSGRRSKMAARIMEERGYENVYEFGGILDWPFEVTSK